MQGHRRGRALACGKDELVVLYLAGANRDPKVFTDPHRFDIERDNAGRHCRSPAAGTSASVRRWPAPKGEVGLRTFFERYPDARLAGTGSRRDTRVLRGWSSLPDRAWQARAAQYGS